ncbi:unnamed protein product [Ilex paraguariensis]|uniref:Uncharacterized protein n=1 Tax=Ilex paraguariensis TaxID=185542 RepID=A0ABC8TK58_9AQUA
MAVGTIVCASLWSEFTAYEQSDERYNELSPKMKSPTSCPLFPRHDMDGRRKSLGPAHLRLSDPRTKKAVELN